MNELIPMVVTFQPKIISKGNTSMCEKNFYCKKYKWLTTEWCLMGSMIGAWWKYYEQ